jgi:hypothetical protein
MLTFVGLYADSTFSSCERVTSGASAPHPSASVSWWEGVARARPSGLKAAPPPPTWVGVKTGFLAATGGGLLAAGRVGAPE